MRVGIGREERETQNADEGRHADVTQVVGVNARERCSCYTMLARFVALSRKAVQSHRQMPNSDMFRHIYACIYDSESTLQ